MAAPGSPFEDIFKSVFGPKNKPGDMTTERRVELQYEMLCNFVKRLDEMTNIMEKITDNNGKIIAQVKKLTTRNNEMKERLEALEAAAAMIVDVTPMEPV